MRGHKNIHTYVIIPCLATGLNLSLSKVTLLVLKICFIPTKSE